jgi:predicted transcriptional regulator
MMNFNFESVILTGNHTFSIDEIKNLAKAKRETEIAYQYAKESVLQSLIEKMKNNKLVFTASEIAEITGLTPQSVASTLCKTFGIFSRERLVKKTYCEIENGQPNLNSVVTLTRRVREYYAF